MKQQIFSNEQTYIPTYLRVEPVFDRLDSNGNEIKRPDFWKENGELIVWGYRISGSNTSFYSQIDCLSQDKLNYIHLCQYMCDRMTDLLDYCITEISNYNLNPKDFNFRIYHYCDYLSFEDEQQLSLKLHRFVNSGKFNEESSKGKLASKVSAINEIQFSVGGGSRTLIWEVEKKKRSFAGEIMRHKFKS